MCQKKTIYLIIAFATLIASCKNSTKSTESKSNKTVIIFNNPVCQSVLNDAKGEELYRIMPQEYISYIDANGNKKLYLPKPNIDTLIIECGKCTHIELIHRYNAIEDVSFLFQVGDTIIFNYDTNKYPIATSKTSAKLTDVYNFNKSIPHRSSYFNVDGLSLLMSHFFKTIYKAKINNKYIPETLVDYYIPLDSVQSDFNKYMSIYKHRIDSLYSKKIIDRSYYSYYNRILNYKKLLSLKTNWLNQEYTQVLVTNYQNEFNDSLTKYISYHNLLKHYFWLECKKQNVEFIRLSNSSYSDFRTVFDNISNYQNIPPKSKQILLIECLNRITEEFSGDDIKKYIDKYLTITNDTLLVKKLKAENHLDFTNTDELKLESLNGETTNLNQVLQKHKNKVIYIDFWASWCAPCRAAMPFAKELRNEYKNKDVVFIYLAKNDTKQPWAQAIIKEGLDSGCENYIITNSKNAKFLEELKINTIPRYILYNKKGVIVNKNAPCSEGVKIREELNKLL